MNPMVESFFTDDEWSAIESALRDYADYGDEESETVELILNKIHLFYKN
jgi:hypothetical protein